MSSRQPGPGSPAARRFLASCSAIGLLALLGCTGPDDGATTPHPDGTAIAEVGEIGVLADMTALECAVAGSPWRIDDMQFDRDYSGEIIATDPTIASAGIGGNYALDLWDDGRIQVSTVGYTLSATSKGVDETGAFDHVRVFTTPGRATAEWSDISEDGSTASFIDWSSDIVEAAPVHDDGTPYTGVLPAWQLPGRAGAVFECDPDGTGLWVRSTTPGYLDLHFVR